MPEPGRPLGTASGPERSPRAPASSSPASETPEFAAAIARRIGCSLDCFDCTAIENLPEGQEWRYGGVFLKEIRLPKALMLVAQHVHAYDHQTLLAHGSVTVWKEGKLFGTFEAPDVIRIAAGVAHAFQSLEDDTVLYCIHNLHGHEAVALEQVM